VEVAKSPEEYGLDGPRSSPTRFETVEVTRPISLKAVAELCGADEETIKDLNPALNRGIVPPQGYRIRLPKGTREQFEVALASYREPIRATIEPRAARSHTVLRGETLSGIADRYGVSQSSLLRANRRGGGRALRAGQQPRIPAKPGSSRVVASAPRSSRFD